MTRSPDPAPTKDCYVCERRRINCDRARPTCVKCSNKGLDCPGYGIRLRWKTRTAARQTLAVAARPMSTRGSCSQQRGDGPPETTLLATTLSGSSECVSDRLSALATQRLLEIYCSSVAPMMVWLDSEQNGYKSLVVPLADTHRVLRLAILATAAARAPSDIDVAETFSQWAHDTALTMIAVRVGEMADIVSQEHATLADAANGTNEATLAAALILSHHSLLGFDRAQFVLHRQAVRTLIEAIVCTGTSDERLFDFLQNQAAIHDVLVSTTRLDPEQVRLSILPNRPQEVLFGQFLCYLHDLTLLSITDAAPPTISELEDRFELATASTLMIGASAHVQGSQLIKNDFIRVVQIYRHAGVLYACKRLKIANAILEEDYHTRSLFRLFNQFENLPTSLYNLAWPILIAGICSWPNIERIQIVRYLTNDMLDRTQFRYYSSISAFHEELWRSPDTNWLDLAADWEQRGQQIIPV